MVFISKQGLYLSGFRLVIKKGFVTKVTAGSYFLSYGYRDKNLSCFILIARAFP